MEKGLGRSPPQREEIARKWRFLLTWQWRFSKICVLRFYREGSKCCQVLDFVVGDIENPGTLKELGTYNMIYSTFSLHHWKDPVAALKQIYELLSDTGIMVILDLKRVWWLYWISSQSGFFQSIRASYTTKETRDLLRKAEIRNFEIQTVVPFFMHMITAWKQ